MSVCVWDLGVQVGSAVTVGINYYRRFAVFVSVVTEKFVGLRILVVTCIANVMSKTSDHEQHQAHQFLPTRSTRPLFANNKALVIIQMKLVDILLMRSSQKHRIHSGHTPPATIVVIRYLRPL